MSRENKAITIHGLSLRKGGVLRKLCPRIPSRSWLSCGEALSTLNGERRTVIYTARTMIGYGIRTQAIFERRYRTRRTKTTTTLTHIHANQSSNWPYRGRTPASARKRPS
jgi:hypothetical protein